MAKAKSKGSAFVFMMLGFLALLGLSGWLYSTVIYESYGVSTFVGVLMTIVLVGLVYQYIDELKSAFKIGEHTIKWGKEDISIYLWLVIGSMVTFFLSNNIGLGAVVASAVVGILAALVFPKFAVPIFCGSFAGMVSETFVDGNYLKALLAAGVAGIIFVLAKMVFNGFGGKLGTIAFGGCLAMIYLTGQTPDIGVIPTGNTALTIMIWAVIGTVLTYVISVRFKHGPVMASGIVGLLGGLIFPAIYPAIPALAAAFYSASFAGMSSTARFKNELPVVLVGLLVGAIFILSMPHLGGAGGKLGTIAFLSAISANGLVNILKWLKAQFFSPCCSNKDHFEISSINAKKAS